MKSTSGGESRKSEREPFLRFRPGSRLPHFFRKIYLELPCTSFHPLANLHTEHLCEPQTETGTEHRGGLSSPVRVDSCAKIPQLRSQLGRTGKNFRCRWLKIPLAHFMGCPCLQHTEFPVAAQQSTRANTHAQWYVSRTRLQDVSVI